MAVALGSAVALASVSSAAAAATFSWDPQSPAGYATDFDQANQTFAGVQADTLQFFDAPNVDAIVHSHSGPMTWNITATIDGVLTTIYTGTFGGSGFTDISNLGPISFAGGIVTSIGFTSSPFQSQSYHGFIDSDAARDWGFASPTTFSLTSNGSAVPEPSTWAMMLLGFGAVGFSMRRRNLASRPLMQIA